MKIKFADSLLIKNNISVIWADKKARIQIILIPLLIAVFIPVVFIFIAKVFELSSNLDSLHSLLPETLSAYNSEQTVHYISTNVVSVMLFPLIPITVSCAASSACLIGEKEDRTILAILTSPISSSVIIRLKYISSALLSAAVTFVCAFCFFIVASVGNIIFSTSFFFDSVWAITIFFIAPGISLFTSLLITLLAPRFEKRDDAREFSSFLIFPLLVFYLLEFTGLYKITATTLFVFTICVYVLDLLLLFIVENRFKLENFLDFKE